MQPVVNIKHKKPRESNFFPVLDPAYRKTIAEITKCPKDASNFTFSCSKNNLNEWGLTIKLVPKKTKTNPSPQHVWKLTWTSNAPGSLVPNPECTSIASTLTEDDYDKLYEIFKVYNKSD